MAEIQTVPDEEMRSRRYGTYVLIAPFVLGVLALIAAYLGAKDSTEKWPPSDVAFDNYASVMVMVTLAMGSVMLEWAARSVGRGTVLGSFLAGAFGLASLNSVVFIFNGLDFGVGTHTYGTLFYALYGLMAFAIGIVSLLAFGNGIRALNDQANVSYFERTRQVANVWHVLVAIWFLGLVVIFWMQ